MHLNLLVVVGLQNTVLTLFPDSAKTAFSMTSRSRQQH